VNVDTGLVTLADGGGRLGTGRVVETDETTEDKVLLEETTLEFSLVVLNMGDISSGGKGKDTETKTGESFHVGDDIRLDGVCELKDLVTGSIGGARINDTLDGTLSENPLLVVLAVMENNGHLLDVGVEGKFGNLVPAGVLTTRQAHTVPVETRSENLHGNLSGVTTSVPLTLDLVNGSKVGKRGNVEVLHQTRVLANLVGSVNSDARGLFVTEVDVLGLVLSKADFTLGRVEGLIGLTKRVCATAGNPGLLDNHSTLGKGTSLVRANVGDGTKSFQTLEVTDNNVSLDHALGTSSHGDGENDNQRGGNHRKTGSDSVDDYILLRLEVVGGQNDDGANNGSSEKDKSELGKLALKRGTNIDTKEATDGIGTSQGPGLGMTSSAGLTLGVALGLATLRRLASKSNSDLTDFGVCSSSKDNTASSTLGNSGRAVGDVETVTRTSFVFKDPVDLLADGKGLSGEKGFVGFEVDSLDKTEIGRDSVTSLELDHVTRDDLDSGDGLVVTVSNSLGSWGAEGAKGVHGLSGLELLKETNDDVEENDSGDDTTLDPRLNTEGSSHGEDEDLLIDK